MKKNFRVLRELIRIRFQHLMLFRLGFFGPFFVDGSLFAVQLMVFGAVYSNVDRIGAWGEGEMILFIGTFSLINAVGMAFYFFGIRQVPDKIRNGELDLYLTKPVSPLLRLTFEQINPGSLPLIAMTFASLGGMTRYTRAAMSEALSLDCIRTARAKGLRERVVVYSHAFRNALIPIITLVIGWFTGIFSGSIVIENIFGLNGVGRIYIESLSKKDFEVVLLLQMFYVILGLVGNLVVDLAYGLADPRVRVNK